MKTILQELHDKPAENQISNNLITALLLLPILLHEPSNILYTIFPKETAAEKAKTTMITPHISIIGSPFEKSLIFVMSENDVIITTEQFIDAVVCTVALYYIFNIKFPTKGQCTYKFIECKLLNLNLKDRIPKKTIKFLRQDLCNVN